jgi:hypothetical protein
MSATLARNLALLLEIGGHYSYARVHDRARARLSGQGVWSHAGT